MAKKTTQGHVVTILKILSALGFILAAVFIFLLVISQSDKIQLWYQTYQSTLQAAEDRVEAMTDRGLVVFIVLFLFMFKGVFPVYLYPLPALCAVTSTVFDPYISIPINIAGLIILYSLKFMWGRRVGANEVSRILQRNETVKYFIEKDGRGNPWLLPLFRFIPGIPINMVSKLYGAMGFRYRDFILLSLTGYFPLLIFYTFIGRNVFNPLSTAFLLPFVLMFSLVGIATFTLSKILQKQSRRKKKNG
ncbi:MAG: VTT domain-containing protein [Clostridia bacterium]|nr:VTT domain-containing protein [Clostridia bacterium]